MYFSQELRNNAQNSREDQKRKKGLLRKLGLTSAGISNHLVLNYSNFLKSLFCFRLKARIYFVLSTLKECTEKLKYFNRFACFWPKGYQLGSLGKSHQNGDYLKQAMRKIVFPQESNLQPLDYRSTALPLELEKTPPRMHNFGYLNPATCLLYDCNNKSIKMFFDVCWPEFNILIVLRASGLKATSSEA